MDYDIDAIGIHVHWKGQTAAELSSLMESWLSPNSGAVGFLREDYDGEPYATRYMFAEVFGKNNSAKIPAAWLRERLPTTLLLAARRARTIYQANAKEVKQAKQNWSDFVAFCERKEKETGEPVLIVASF